MSITITTAGNGTTESNAISNKISISCPQTAEEKDTEAMDEEYTNLSSKTDTTFSTTDETNETEDFNYNPNEETQPESEDITSDSESEEEELNKEEEYDEETIINSLEFQKEFVEAIENVKYIAKYDREIILSKIGEEETDSEVIEQAFDTFTIEKEEISVSEESEYDSCDERVLEKEYCDAIKHICELGKIDKEIFVNEICDTYSEFNNKEITIEELKNIFSKIRNNFADEAKEEWMEINNNESDSDSDYDANNQIDLQQFERDTFIDKKQKIEIVFIDNNSDSEFYSNESESENVSSDDEYNSSDSESEVSEEEESNDSYLPEKDSFDYSQDIEDEKTFTNELNGTDLNEISCDDKEQ